ncbi:CPBP family glutamic-type intramembrane protease [Flavitalea sp.]|nr:CPBP family glutamic-type intramembrane protease [Flavitalea sp.]
MFSFTRKSYFVVFTILYVGSIVYLYKTGYPTVHLLATLFSYTLILPLLAYFISLKSRKAVSSQPFFYREWITLLALIAYIIIYISWGDHFLGRGLSAAFSDNPKTLYLLDALKEVVFYFVIPFSLYRFIYGFTLREAGLHIPFKHVFSRQNIITFLVLATAIIILQYYFNEELDQLWEGEYTRGTLFTAIPILFVILFFKAGLAYGFFFRALMQSRFSIGLNSKFGGMLVSLLIFGLAHLPLYLKEGIPDKHEVGHYPGELSSLAICIGIISINSLFIAIIWRRSKNLWLVMGLYAILELLPNLHHFIATWM